MIDYLYKVGDVVTIQAPSFLNGEAGYIKELCESVMLAYGDDNRCASYRVHLFHNGEELVFLETSIEAIA